MLSARRRVSRWVPGFTLAELLVVILLGGLVLALVFSIGARLQRELVALALRIGGGGQLRSGAAILALDLRAVSSTGGDIAPGEARDTSLQLRSTVLSAVACAVREEEIDVMPLAGANGAPAGGTLRVGDTLWVLADADSGERWLPMAALGVRSAPDGCATVASGIAERARLFDVGHMLAVRVGRECAALIAPGAPIRVARGARYSIYRASDGRWYLGLRSWSTASGQFSPIQPVSGPYVPLSSDGGGTRFRYFDVNGAAVAEGALETRRIARVEVSLVSEASDRVDTHHDSLGVVVALRNAR